MTELRLLIVDDEAPARQLLRQLLAGETGVRVVGEAASGREAIREIGQLKPDVVLLDVQMPDGDGLSVVSTCRRAPIAWIFITAFESYAVTAFEVAAADYVVKPVAASRLRTALERVRQHRQQLPAATWKAYLEEAVDPMLAVRAERLIISERQRVVVVPVSDILYLETSDHYVAVHTAHRQHLVSESLVSLLDRLGADRFARIHRRFAVAIDRVEQVVRSTTGSFSVQLAGNVQLPIARQRRSIVAQLLARMGDRSDPAL